MSKFDDMMASLEKEILATESGEDQEAALERLKEIAKEYEGEDRVVSSDELRKEIESTPPKPKFYSGFSTLDAKMEGFESGESIFVSGITKHGKTALMMELSVRFAEQQPLWLSFEEKPIDLMRKFHSKTGEYPHFFTPRRNEKKTLEWVENKIIEGKAKYGSKVVFLDHIGFVKDDELRAGELEASCYERISRAIHTMAVKWDVLFFHLGHLTKVGITQNPDIENIKGSSAMSQEADLTMLIWRKTERINGKVEKGNETNLSLQANRRGQEGNVQFLYQGGRFFESAWEQEKQPEEDNSWDS